MSESQFYYFPATGNPYGIKSLGEAIEAVGEGGYMWFNFYQPSREMLNTLADKIGIHPLSVEDCFDEEQVPKIEYFINNTFIIFNSFTYLQSELFIDEVNLFIGKNFLITVSGTHSDGRKPIGNLPGKIETGNTNAKNGPDYLLQIVLDWLVDEKYKALDDMEDELETAEESLLENVEKFKPMQLIRNEKKSYEAQEDSLS